MGSILTKIGIIVFFFIYSIFIFSLFNFRKRINILYFILFLLGIAAFLSVFIESPLEHLLALLTSPSHWNIQSDILKAFLYSLIPGFVEELFKALAAFTGKNKILSGASAGAGFGFGEVVFKLSHATYFSAGVSTGVLIAIIGKLLGITFHSSSTSLIMYGATKRKFFLYYLIVSLIHTAVDTIGTTATIGPQLILGSIITLSLFIISIALYKREFAKG